ncbi:MAG: MerR family transcriptional regulator, partial [Hyphomicrobium sp.]
TIARAHLAEVERRLTSLRALRSELKQMIENCARGRVGQCRVIEVLADHGQCHNDHDKR